MVKGSGNRGELRDSLIVTISSLALKYHRKCSEKAIATLGPRTDNLGTRTKGITGDTTGASPR
jgi:hypothetical protein